jgi:hypothetical protein
MASIVLAGNTSGSITISSPSVSGSNTLTLPANTGTVLTSASNTGFPAGSVIQVVQTTYSTQTSNSTGTYADTGLTASITPSSSSNKILVIANQMGVNKINDTAVNFNLCRNGTNINNFVDFAAGTSSASEMGVGSCVFTYLDCPATTSSVTFKTQFLSRSGIAAARVQYLSATSTMTLMEIKG